MEPSKHIVVLGAGLSGLSAAYDLLNAGYRVTVIESSPFVGGLASSIQFNGNPVERFYHFICRADHDLIDFVKELGLKEKLHWCQSHTAFFHNGKQYSFGTPLDLLFFNAVPWEQRLRFGLHILQSRRRSQWRWLDKIPAKPWLIENIGQEAYQVIWHPLLQIKFGQYHETISAAWVWHRIWRVAQSRRWIWERESFGYLENGSATLVDHLIDFIHAHPYGLIKSNISAQTIDIKGNRVDSLFTERGPLACDAVISTMALPVLAKILPHPQKSLLKKYEQIQYIGVVCTLFNLNRPFSRNFWMNINDPSISFNGIIEQTNLNQNLRTAGLNLIYIPFYLPISQARYQADDEELFSEYIPMLRRINPLFEAQWIVNRAVFRTPYAQAICTTGFSELIPEIRSSISGLYLTDSTQFYPEDRTISAAIRQGRKAAKLVLQDFNDFNRNTL